MRNQAMIWVLCAALVLGSGGAGFGIGRTTGIRKGRAEAVTEANAQAAAEAAGKASTVTEESAAQAASADTGNTQAAAAEASTEASAEEAASDGELVDAADKYNEEHKDDAAAEASTEEEEELDIGDHGSGGEEVQADPAFVKNPTFKEASLPDGVASTLYGKDHDDTKMQIVVMGDSQFGNFKGENGLAYLIAQRCKANVYNLAIGGTAAAVEPNSGTADETWDSTSGIGMAKAVAGVISPDFFESRTYTYEVFKSCDFAKTDLFILEYGVNDYFQKSPLYDPDFGSNLKTTQGAIDVAINTLHNAYPDAKILVITPGYTQFFQEGTGTYLGDVNTLNNGYGTLQKYIEFVSHGAEPHTDCARILNMYVDLDVNGYNAKDTLMDGIHYTDEGRQRYARVLSRRILQLMGYSIPEDVSDTDTIDWASQEPDRAAAWAQ